MMDIQEISTNLTLGPDEIWYSQDCHEISYPPDGNEACATIEDTSFWFRHRNNCILSVVITYPPHDKGTIFDIGGGNGFVAMALAASGFDVVLMEPGRTGAFNAKSRGVDTVICATPETAKLKSHSLSAIGLFDVVEHIEDDLAFLRTLHGLLRSQGRLYITVPAYSFLWSGEDESAGHYRRYDRKRICSVIENAGFEVDFFSYMFRFLPIPIAFFRALPYRIGVMHSKEKARKLAQDHAAQGGLTSRILDLMLHSEVENLKRKKSLRFGGSCLVVATKREDAAI